MAGNWSTGELLAFDLETTGVDKYDDVPVSFALVSFRDGLAAASRYSLVDPGREIPEGAAAVHGISTEQARSEGIELDRAVGEIVEALLDASRRGVPVVGFNLSYDLTMIDSCCRRLDGRGLRERSWSGPVLDPLVIDRGVDRYRKGQRTLGALCELYGVVNKAAHDARGDAEASALLLLSMVAERPELDQMDLAELYAQEEQWYVTWAGGFSDYLMRNGKPGFEEREFCWPLQVITDRLF